MKVFRHRLANRLLLVVFKLTSVRFIRRAAAWFARIICGPLDPERLYCTKLVRVMSLPRAAPIVNARPNTYRLPDAHPEDSELERWLAKEAQ